MSTWFRVTFVKPNGYTYEATGRAASPEEAVRLADETIEYVERVGISDVLSEVGLTVRPPARLWVDVVDESVTGSGFGLVITDPDGRVPRK
jgi:hypothetical protein